MTTLTRIAVIGGESTGKTSLATALATQHDAVIARDMLRDFVGALGRTPRRDEQDLVFALQADAAAAARMRAVATGRHVVIADPDPFMIAVYSMVYFDDDHLIRAGLASLREADAIVWCRPDIPWHADDAQRDGEAYRAAADSCISKTLPDLAGRVISTTNERTTHPAWVPDLSAFLP